MQQFNIFQAIYMSFYSKKLYRDVALNWGGKAFLYLLLIIALVSVYFAIAVQGLANVAYKQASANIFPQIPEISIKDGKLSTPEKRPYFITDTNKKIFAVIDTTGQYKTLAQANAPLLVTETQIITEPKPNEMRIYTIPAKMEQKIVPQQIDFFLQKFIKFLWIAFFFTILIGFYLYRVIQALLYAIIGKIFSLIFSVKIGYGQILQIAMVALTPAIILSTLEYAFTFHVMYELLLYFILTLIYLFYGIMANKN